MIGREIGVGEDEIHAIMDVETISGGFDDQGRLKILFEAHVFYRNLPAGKANAAVAKKPACRSWGQLSYGKSSEQYGKLEWAMKID